MDTDALAVNAEVDTAHKEDTGTPKPHPSLTMKHPVHAGIPFQDIPGSSYRKCRKMKEGVRKPYRRKYTPFEIPQVSTFFASTQDTQDYLFPNRDLPEERDGDGFW